MSIKTYLEHRQLMRLIAILLTILMLYSCLSICMIDAEAAALEIGISLIALILAGFGVVASTTGAIDGMNQGLESLMGEFSESQGHETGWFKGLFNTDNITTKGYNRLGVGGVLVAGIKLFIEWLRTDKGLSESEPILYNGESFILIGTDSLPVNIGSPLTLNPSNCTPLPVHTYSSTGEGNLISFYTSDIYLGYDKPTIYCISLGPNYYTFEMHIGHGLYAYSGGTSSYKGYLYDGFGFPYLYLIYNPDIKHLYLSAANNYSDTFVTTTYGTLEVNVSTLNLDVSASDGWQIDDNNLDTDYLDNDDDSTKDVIFTPAYPADMPLDDLDLGTIGGMEDAADRTYDYTKSETGTAVGEGEITTESNLQPGDNEVPDISIPEGGFFSSIWHYVVQAMQDAAEGIAFLFNLVYMVVPPAILNLAWASVVLVIIFGILNKFLE